MLRILTGGKYSMKFGARLKFSDGDLVDVEGEFDTREEAREAAMEDISAYHVGCDVLSYCDYDGDAPEDETPRIYIHQIK